MTGPFGANILSQTVRDRNALMHWLQQAQPAACVVMDSADLAQQIRALLPNSIVISRTFNANDSRWHTATTPAQWLTAHLGFALHGVCLQVMNEPTIDDAALTWLETLCALCPPHVRLALPNFAVGNPFEGDILAGKYDRLLRLVCGTRHFLALHEYFKNDPVMEAPYLCGRFDFWLRRAAMLGLPAPSIVITEHGRDIGGGRKDGWRDTAWSENNYFQRFADAQSLYAPHNIPVCIFSWGNGFNDDWLSFDIQDATTLQQHLIDWNKQNPIQENPMPDWTTHDWGQRIDGALARLAARVVINVREQPIETSADRGDLRDGLRLSYWNTPFTGTKFRWYKVLYEGAERFVAEVAGLRFEAPEPPPAPEIPAWTPQDSAVLDTAMTALDTAKGSLDYLKRRFAPTGDGGGF